MGEGLPRRSRGDTSTFRRTADGAWCPDHDAGELHTEITSGRPGAASDLGRELVRHSRTLDDCCNDVLDGLTGVRWDSGTAALAFRVKGQTLYAVLSAAGWRTYRLGDALKEVARQYEVVVQEADRLLRTWQELSPEQKDEPATRGSWVRALTALRTRWSTQLDDLAADLVDDDDEKTVEDEDGDSSRRQSDEDWVVEGAEQDFISHLTNGTRRGPRIPNSYLNSGDDWVHQGLAFHRGQYFLSSYGYDPTRSLAGALGVGGDLGDNPKTSNLTTVDAQTGAETGSVTLAGPPSEPLTQPQHSGGVTVMGDSVYVVSSETVDGENSPHVYRYSLSAIEDAAPGETVRAAARFGVPASSYISSDGENFYLGKYEESGSGELHTVSRDDMEALEEGYRPVLDSIATPPGVNGATVLPDRIIYSQNDGRSNPSSVIEQPRALPYLPAPFPQVPGTETGSLIEENTKAGDDLAFLHEAGARAYSPVDDESGDGDGTDDLWGQSHMTVAPGAAGTGGMDIEVEPQSLRSASRTFADISDSVSTVRGATLGVELPASSLGDVPGGAALSRAVRTQAGKFSDDLTDGEKDAEIMFDGLRWCADGYELADHESFSALDSFGGLLNFG